MKTLRVILILLACILVFATARAQSQIDYTDENRSALVIGNSGYKMGRLANPVNDARAMAAILEQLGFNVILRTEIPNKDEMKRVIREFRRLLEKGGVGLFYYAGHGLQVDGINYLIPVEAQIFNEEEVEYECVEAGFVLAQMEIARNRMNVVIMDACRDNPFARSFRSYRGGLATINAPTGTLIAYATAPGSVASDGTGKNGLYTEILLNEIQVKGQKIEETFKNVRRGVLDMSDGRQIPWESSSLIGDFYFVPPATTTEPAEETTALKPQPIRTEDPAVPATTETITAELTWKADNTGAYLFRNNNPYNENTEMSWAGNDMIVYDKEIGKTYVLRNCSGVQDNQLRAAEPLEYSGNLFWKKNGAGYYLFEKGIPIQNKTVSDWFGDHLWVVNEDGESGYILRDYRNTPSSDYKPAEVINITSPMMWGKVMSSEIFMFENGKRLVTEANKQIVNKDILVYSTITQNSYLLEGYTTVEQGSLQAARTLGAGSNAYWKANREGYWFYVKGTEVTNNTDFEWTGKDLQVLYGDNTYLLTSYTSNQDNKIRPAELIAADRTAVEETTEPQQAEIQTETKVAKAEWKANRDYYWLYLDGKEVSSETDFTWTNNRKDMIVTHIPTGRKFIFRNYLNSRDNKMRAAEEIK
ncbi:MAG: caspase family protein [Bacteroidales bacterium]|nr:MAG: caspase family protein [Bacteroidales bacterium]